MNRRLEREQILAWGTQAPRKESGPENLSALSCRYISSGDVRQRSLTEVLDVVHVALVRRSRSCPGFRRIDPQSSFEKLQSGEDFFDYSFLIYWEGFAFHCDKQGSNEGFYS